MTHAGNKLLALPVKEPRLEKQHTGRQLQNDCKSRTPHYFKKVTIENEDHARKP